MFCLTYDIWNEIVDDVVGAHIDLFEAMHHASEQLQLSKPLIDDLKSRGMKEIGTGPESLLLKIDLLEDKIGGFRIYLMAAEDVEVFEELKAEVASDHGFCIEEIEGFELEHGMDMDEEIFEEMKERLWVDVEIDETSSSSLWWYSTAKILMTAGRSMTHGRTIPKQINRSQSTALHGICR